MADAAAGTEPGAVDAIISAGYDVFCKIWFIEAASPGRRRQGLVRPVV